MYDENGDVTGGYYNGTPFAYAKNLQGDVLGIIDGNGVWVVSYEYDAWGNPLSVTGSLAGTLGAINPFRYRSYVYDEESGLYYLNSRYYDPEVGRFLNADGYASTGQDIQGCNMFAYCGNNPVNRADSSGEFWFAAIVVATMVICATLLSGCSNNKNTQPKSVPYSGQANCYAYAMKLENDPRTNEPFKRKPQPGEFSGNALTVKDLKQDRADVKKTITTKVSEDAKVLNFTFNEVSSAEYVTKSGNWLVALAYATDGTDYHWWRRNNDGTWSHKPGATPVVYWDVDGRTITDPASCNRGIYDGFLGYYEVGPN